MPVEDNEAREPTPRRMLTRRARAAGGFSGGSSTSTESLRLSNDAPQPHEAEPDEVDDIIDPEAMQRNILRNTHAASGAPTPQQRLNQVNFTGSESYSKEYRLVLMHRMLARRVPLDQIANTLGISISTAEKYRVELKQFLRAKARELNIDEMVGSQLETYNEISGMAMRIAGSADGERAVAAPIRLAAMRTVLAAEADRTRFLNSAGVFDAMTFRRGEDGSELSDVQRLMNSTNDLIERVLTEEGPAETPRAIRRRKGGFGELTMDDKDASSGDQEFVDL